MADPIRRPTTSVCDISWTGRAVACILLFTVACLAILAFGVLALGGNIDMSFVTLAIIFVLFSILCGIEKRSARCLVALADRRPWVRVIMACTCFPLCIAGVGMIVVIIVGGTQKSVENPLVFLLSIKGIVCSVLGVACLAYFAKAWIGFGLGKESAIRKVKSWVDLE